MANPIEYLSGARLDFDESFDWYGQRSIGAAIGFAAAVDEAIDKIFSDPDRFPTTVAGCRYCSLHSYPFRIIFRTEASRIVIVAVAHAKRRPSYWRGRL